MSKEFWQRIAQRSNIRPENIPSGIKGKYTTDTDVLGEVTGLTLSGGDELRVLLSADSDEWEVTLPEGASWVVVRNNEPVMTDAELDAIKRIFQPEIDGGGK